MNKWKPKTFIDFGRNGGTQNKPNRNESKNDRQMKEYSMKMM